VIIVRSDEVYLSKYFSEILVGGWSVVPPFLVGELLLLSFSNL
jgi:hypothetical protein